VAMWEPLVIRRTLRETESINWFYNLPNALKPEISVIGPRELFLSETGSCMSNSGDIPVFLSFCSPLN